MPDFEQNLFYDSDGFLHTDGIDLGLLNTIKGQSAIEYLMTYGWMLLVVAVAGGAIFSIVGDQTIESVSGFTGGDLDVVDFGLNAENDYVEMVIRNNAATEVEINYVNISNGEDYTSTIYGPEIPVTNAEPISVLKIGESTGTNNLEVTINYNSGSLENLTTSGTVIGSIEVLESYKSSYSHNTEPADLDSVLSQIQGEGTEENPYRITNDYELQAINAEKNAFYELQNNIGVQNTRSWNNGKGFEPIGDSENRFSGSFDGVGYQVAGLNIYRENTTDVGLFGSINGKITDIGVVNGDITGKSHVGALVGRNRGLVSNSYSSGSVRGKGSSVGGLIGQARFGEVEKSYSMASATAEELNAGGLVGEVSAGSINRSYATGFVVAEGFREGGLTGHNHDGGEVTESYWDMVTTGQETSPSSSGDGGTGLTTGEMQGTEAENNMVGFDFSNRWSAELDSYPSLKQ